MSSKKHNAFSGYQWTYYSVLQPGPQKSRAEIFLAFTNWEALLKYSAEKRHRLECALLVDIALGYNHIVRIIHFTDETRWIARLRLPPLSNTSPSEAESVMQSEIATIALVQWNSTVPVPQVHAFEGKADYDVGASFMLIDCLEGNVEMDLGMGVPAEKKDAFFDKLLEVHVELSAIQLPKIGTIVSINDDSTVEQGPIPGLGGPFDTATQYFEAQMSRLKFGMSEERVRDIGGPYADDILQSVASFTKESRSFLRNSLRTTTAPSHSVMEISATTSSWMTITTYWESLTGNLLSRNLGKSLETSHSLFPLYLQLWTPHFSTTKTARPKIRT
jgi:hypothetical protein